MIPAKVSAARLSYFTEIEDDTDYPYPDDEVTRLVQELALDSEAATSLVLIRSRDSTARKIPTNRAIYQYWGKTLVRLNKFDSLFEIEDGEWRICWACGVDRDHSLDRAHILARVSGGSDEASNLHMLCQLCHKDSEHLWGREYWDWFMQGGWFGSALRRAGIGGESK